MIERKELEQWLDDIKEDAIQSLVEEQDKLNIALETIKRVRNIIDLIDK